LEKSTEFPRRTSKTPPPEGTRVTVPIRLGIDLRNSSARPAARFSYPQEVQYSIDRSISSAIGSFPRHNGPADTVPVLIHCTSRTIPHGTNGVVR
jgi:hypothetical protein